MVMTETEKEIVAINAAALMKATGKKPPKKTEKEKKQKK